MDHASFDRLTRLFGTASTRRGALVAIAGIGLAVPRQVSAATRHGRNRGKGKAVSAAATCGAPGPSSNLNGCDFTGADFTAENLSSSLMVATIFRNAELVKANLSGSTMTGANFRGADLCGANLSSSQLKNADFRGANLTRTDARSSGCKGIVTNENTIACQTIDCDGKLRNDSCPGVDPSDVCCVDADCGLGERCNSDNRCVCNPPVCTLIGVCVDNDCITVPV